MTIENIKLAKEMFGIDDWGQGYFSIDDKGLVCVHPSCKTKLRIPLQGIVTKLREKKIKTPLIVRFPQIITRQLDQLHSSFRKAIKAYAYQGKHLGVFPFKVNQRKEFIDAVVQAGRNMNYGLEVGSKTELIAALGYELAEQALLICNGFKDDDFIEMAFIASAMGKNVNLVIEGPDELHAIVAAAQYNKHIPGIGLRVRLYCKGTGKWENSSGEASKFGLTTIEVLQALKIIEQKKLHNHLNMLHFHIGSQVTEIKRFKEALKEAARVYAKIYKLGFPCKYLNIGGGLGVDYDGSKTSYESSANYNMEEFASDAIYMIGEVCKDEGVPPPDIVTESGRVIAAYHSVLITDIREVQGLEVGSNIYQETIDLPGIDKVKNLTEMKYILDNINRKNYNEYYHDSVAFREELFTLFNLGYLTLSERAAGEELFQKICQKTLFFSSYERRQSPEFDRLQKRAVSKYLANFSIFQSIPDSWAIDQLFPVMPIARHNEEPSHRSLIVDITCDSDGCIDRYIDKREDKSVIDLHKPNGFPYYIGIFLVGAYQESLANEHNLFGAINEAEVYMSDVGGNWEITKITKGDPIDELLECRNYNIPELMESYKLQLNRSVVAGRITGDEAHDYYKKLGQVKNGLPYLDKLSH